MDFAAEPNTLSFLLVRSAILVVACMVFAFALHRWRADARQSVAKLELGLADAMARLQALADDQTVQAGRVLRLLEQLKERVDSQRVAEAAAQPSSRNYDLALRLGRAGSTVDEIEEISGVARQEAQLIVSLHGPRPTGRDSRPLPEGLSAMGRIA